MRAAIVPLPTHVGPGANPSQPQFPLWHGDNALSTFRNVAKVQGDDRGGGTVENTEVPPTLLASGSKPNRQMTPSQRLDKRNPPPRKNRKGEVLKGGDPRTEGKDG